MKLILELEKDYPLENTDRFKDSSVLAIASDSGI